MVHAAAHTKPPVGLDHQKTSSSQMSSSDHAGPWSATASPGSRVGTASQKENSYFWNRARLYFQTLGHYAVLYQDFPEAPWN